MQPDGDARHPGVEDVERKRFRAMKARRHHHHGGGIETPAHHEIADRHIDGRRYSVVVGAKPDTAAFGKIIRRKGKI
jgi:hypothetical protein